MPSLERNLRALAAGWLLAGLLGAPAAAVPIVGQLSLVGSVRFDADDIDFLPAGGGSGSFLGSDPTDGYFAGLSGTSGLALDLNSAVHPVGVPFSLVSFLAFAVAPTLTFELEFIQPGTFGSAQCGLAAAAGQVCTPAASSPFNFVNIPAGSDISSILSFSVLGTVTDGANAGTFTGVYTAQFAGLSYQEVLATIASGGSLTASYSANFDVVPEPAVAALLGAGLAILALRRR